MKILPGHKTSAPAAKDPVAIAVVANVLRCQDELLDSILDEAGVAPLPSDFFEDTTKASKTLDTNLGEDINDITLSLSGLGVEEDKVYTKSLLMIEPSYMYDF